MLTTSLVAELLWSDAWLSTSYVSPVGMRILMGEGHGWNQAACTPTQAQDPGKSLKRGSFFFFFLFVYTNNTTEVLGTKEQVFLPTLPRRAKGLPFQKRLVRTLSCCVKMS